MKKLCFFVGDINRTGGTERLTSTIANALNKKGSQKIYILSMANGHSPFFELDRNIEVTSLNMENKGTIHDLFKIRKLRNYLKDNSIDILINIDIVLSYFSIPAAVGCKTKTISWEAFNYNVNSGDFTQRARRILGRYLSKYFSQYIVTQTKKDRLYYINNFNCTPKKILCIPNPVDFKISQSANSGCNSKNVLSVGRFTYQKGFDLLLKAWSMINEEVDGWKLVIVGFGEEELKLKSLAMELSIGSSVIFQPKTNDLDKYYSNAAIYAMTPRFEGFGLVLLEAKMFGLPLVSFDCDCGPSDIIRDREDGFLVPMYDLDKFSKKLLELMNDEEMRLKMGSNALADDRFDLQKILPQWEEILA